MKNFNEFKEEIANVAGSGNVAGLGDEPPVSKRSQKIHRRKTAGVTAGVVKKTTKESVELDEAVDHKTRHNLAKKIITAIERVDAPRRAVEKGKWIDSFGDKITDKLNPQLNQDDPGGVEYQQGRGRGDWSFIIDDKGYVKYTYKGKSGKLKGMKFLAFVLKKVKESVELDEYRRSDVYVIVDKKGKVVVAKLTKKNAHKEISRHRGGTIVLDPDAKVGDTLKYFAKESVTFAGSKVFTVTPEEYNNCFHGRKRNERWKRKLNMEKLDRCDIRTYHHKNPGKSIIVQNERTGEMQYLVRGETK